MGRHAFTLDAFIEKACRLHNNKYQYVKTTYTNMSSKIIVTCPIHGDFEVLASNHVRVFRKKDKKHLAPCGCPECGKDSVRKRNIAGTKTTNQFIKEANETHNFKYDYSNTKYKHSFTKVEIVCPEHGSFFQQPANHLRGTGCPLCKNSKGETKIAKILSKRGIKYVKEHVFEDCVSDKGFPLKFDFFIPSKNILIEYDGEQHFKPVRFHLNMNQKTAEEMFKQVKKYDRIKNQYAKQHQITLIRIPYTQLKVVEEILVKQV